MVTSTWPPPPTSPPQSPTPVTHRDGPNKVAHAVSRDAAVVQRVAVTRVQRDSGAVV